MLTGAPVVLLDEPTTGLDTDAEALVVAALARLTHGRIVVMTTHRPALTRLATAPSSCAAESSPTPTSTPTRGARR